MVNEIFNTLLSASSILSNLILKYSHDKLSTYFKALGHPIRMLIVMVMLNGRTYTKDELYNIISKFDLRTTRMSIDRHVRTLESYGIIKPYITLRRLRRGRRPFAYVLSVDAREFFRDIFNYILSSPPKPELRVSKHLVVLGLIKELLKELKLVLYVLPSTLSEELLIHIQNSIKELLNRIHIYVLTAVPYTPVSNYSEALDFLNTLSRSGIIERVGPLKLMELITTSALSSDLPLNTLGVNYDDLSKFSIHELVSNKNSRELLATVLSIVRGDEYYSFIVTLANSIKAYLASNLITTY